MLAGSVEFPTRGEHLDNLQMIAQVMAELSGILDRIRFAEEQTSGGSLAEHGWGLSVIDTIVQRYDGAVSLERSKAGFRMSVMVDLAAQT